MSMYKAKAIIIKKSFIMDLTISKINIIYIYFLNKCYIGVSIRVSVSGSCRVEVGVLD